MTIRVMSYNVHGGKGMDGIRDYSRFHKFMEQQKVDVALFQEFECRASRGGKPEDVKTLQLDPYKHVAFGPTENGSVGWYGNLIISRYPIAGHEVHDLSVNGLEPRNVMDVRIRIPKIGVVRFLNTHLGLMVGERIKQSRKLVELIEKEIDMGLPVILAGDINEWRPYAGLIRAINKILHPVPSGGTYPSRFPRAHLDRMWCYPKNLIDKAVPMRTPDTRKMSDHIPIIADLKAG
jgi:endonuclease/exonuclease/phosphatase family metal-dependent hydrolase